jgi:undecaprenyl diphosphate synthase
MTVESAPLSSLPEWKLAAHEKLPKHIAIIMDGNGRWATTKGWHRSLGHVEGTSRVKPILDECRALGIRNLTLYCFSSENWGRPKEEIDVLMKLLKDYLLRERQELMDNKTRLNIFGDMSLIPKSTRDVMDESIAMLKNNTAYTLNLCVSYGSRNEILKATRQLAQKVKDGILNPSDINEEVFSSQLYTAGIPDPDLLIRTSGEKRISNFLLWQIAYSEIYVTDILWPDFEPKHLHQAIQEYFNRKRRFGLSDEAVLEAVKNP